MKFAADCTTGLWYVAHADKILFGRVKVGVISQKVVFELQIALTYV